MKKLLLLLLLCSPIEAATLATDNFNRADADVGANWASPANGWLIVSNVAVPETLGSDCIAAYDAGITWPADQYSQAKVTVTGTAGSPGVVVRTTAATDTLYWAVVNHGASNNVEVGRKVSGAYTFIASRTTTWVDGDVLRLEVSGTGAARILKVFKNGTQLGANIADASGGIDSGKPGIGYSSSATAASVDDWEGGSLTAASSVVPIIMSQRRRRSQ
jgi:hypothetical protein